MSLASEEHASNPHASPVSEAWTRVALELEPWHGLVLPFCPLSIFLKLLFLSIFFLGGPPNLPIGAMDWLELRGFPFALYRHRFKEILGAAQSFAPIPGCSAHRRAPSAHRASASPSKRDTNRTVFLFLFCFCFVLFSFFFPRAPNTHTHEAVFFFFLSEPRARRGCSPWPKCQS